MANTISDKLTYMNTTKQQIKTALKTDNNILRDYVGMIEKYVDNTPITNSTNKICYNSLGVPFIDYNIYGNSTQDGIPTPSNPVEIKSVGDLVTDSEDSNFGKYKIPVKVSGKNLFNPNRPTDSSTYRGITVINNHDGTYRAYGTSTGVGTISLTSENVHLNANKGYSFAIDILSGVETLGKYQPSITVTAKDSNNNTIYNYFTLSPSSLARYKISSEDINITNVEIYFDTNITFDFTFRLMLEEGSTATEYEPYHEPVTTNIYTNAPLRKKGDLADYINFASQKVVRNLQEKKFDENSTILYVNTTMNTVYGFSIQATGMPNILNTNLQLNNLQNSVYYDYTDDTERYYIQNEVAIFKAKKSLIDSYEGNTIQAKFLNYLNENNWKIDYILSEPIEEDIELPEIPTFEGTTIVEFDTEVQPSAQDFEYKLKIEDNGALNYTPTTSSQTIPAGYTSGGTVSGDADLISSNIKSGVEIFGVSGSSSVIDTSDANALAGDIAQGKTAYVNGVKVIGTLEIPPEPSYTELEYIESTGTQYIDTGIFTATNIKMEVDFVNTFAFANGMSGRALLGGRVSGTNSNYSYTTGDGGDYVGVGTNLLTIQRNGSSKLTKIIYSNTSISITNDDYSYINNEISFSISTPRHIYLFGRNDNGTIGSYGSFRLYNCKIWQGNTLIRNYIPVKDENNVICLYDKISKEFIYNVGTGTFTAGPEI